MMDAQDVERPKGRTSQTHLSRFLDQLADRADLEQLLEVTMIVNPSDLFAIVECEKRVKRHTYDRCVCLSVFLADLCSDARARCDDAKAADAISLCIADAVKAAVTYYDPSIEASDLVPQALRKLASTTALHHVHTSFEGRFRDWRQMVRAVRRTPSAHQIEESPQYGEVTMAMLVADSVGNMLSHIRRMYCDKAFWDYRFCLE